MSPAGHAKLISKIFRNQPAGLSAGRAAGVIVVFCVLTLLLLLPIIGAAARPAAERIPALIVTGQNAHDWKTTSAALKQVLEDTGIFRVDIAVSPPQKEDMSGFRPDFRSFRLVVLDYSGDPWPPSTREAFVDYVKNGGGVVVYHSANNAFPDWPEYNEIIGLAGWGGRDEKAGPYVFWKDGRIIRDAGPGACGQHTPPHEFLVVNRDRTHPVTAGLPERWMHARDELYGLLRGPAKNLHVLATAYSAPEHEGTGRHEPILFTVEYGAGRIFHTVLGHVGAKSQEAIECVGFIATFCRGAEWAATGTVTLPLPPDFPGTTMTVSTPADVRRWPGLRPPSFEALLKDLDTFEFSKNEDVLYRLREYVLTHKNAADARAATEDALLEFLVRSQNPDARMAVCRMLRLIGGEKSAAVLGRMLADETTNDAARYALEKITGAAAEKALLEALAAARGEAKIGLISSLGERRSTAAVDALAALLISPDPALASAAAGALGKIGTEKAAAVLSEALGQAAAERKPDIVSALLMTAELSSASGNRALAAKIYDLILGTRDLAPHLGQAAMKGKIQTAAQDEAARLVLDILSRGPEELHEPAISCIARYFDPSQIAPVTSLLPNLPESSRVQLLSVLSGYPSWSVLPSILQAARSPEKVVRTAALRALARAGDASTVGLLAERAAAARDEEREAARLSLWTMRGKDVDEAVLFGFVSATSEAARAEYLRAIGERQLRAGKAHLLAAVVSGPDRDRAIAVRALRQMSDPEDLPGLLARLFEVEDEAAEEGLLAVLASAALRRHDPRDRVALIEDMLEPGRGSKQKRVEDPKSRARLIRALGKIGDDSSLPFVRASLKDQDASIRDAAVRALAEWPTPTARGDVLSVANSARNLTHKVLALRAYIRMVGLEKYQAPEAAVASLQAALKLASRPEEKILILGALPEFACPQALALAKSLVKDKAVRVEAEAAVARIQNSLAGKK